MRNVRISNTEYLKPSIFHKANIVTIVKVVSNDTISVPLWVVCAYSSQITLYVHSYILKRDFVGSLTTKLVYPPKAETTKGLQNLNYK